LSCEKRRKLRFEHKFHWPDINKALIFGTFYQERVHIFLWQTLIEEHLNFEWKIKGMPGFVSGGLRAFSTAKAFLVTFWAQKVTKFQPKHWFCLSTFFLQRSLPLNF